MIRRMREVRRPVLNERLIARRVFALRRHIVVLLGVNNLSRK
jgi:hypothetical protein